MDRENEGSTKEERKVQFPKTRDYIMDLAFKIFRVYWER